jgi:CoA:oxalate CoA-transferase
MKREIPGVGAHRDEVLSRDLGLSAEAIAGLAEAGAFGKMRG